MAAVSAARRVALDPQRAWALWTDVRLWPSFVEGFARAVERDPAWPQPGARLVWQSTPGGRGRVSEEVEDARPGIAFATRVREDALAGSQRTSFDVADDGRTRVELRLDYELAGGGPLRALTDVLFIRRALTQALQRTLDRFAAEAQDLAAR